MFWSIWDAGSIKENNKVVAYTYSTISLKYIALREKKHSVWRCLWIKVCESWLIRLINGVAVLYCLTLHAWLWLMGCKASEQVCLFNLNLTQMYSSLNTQFFPVHILQYLFVHKLWNATCPVCTKDGIQSHSVYDSI